MNITKQYIPSVVKHLNKNQQTIPKFGICVDCGQEGNPGKTFFRGVDISTGEVIFEEIIEGVSTNNIGEYVAICFAIRDRTNPKTPIYSDSMTALTWVKKKKASSTIELSKDTEHTFKLLRECETILNEYYTTDVYKWDTKNWGENIADYGRK